MGKTTIEELEKILDGETGINLEILPNGEIKEVGRKKGEKSDSLVIKRPNNNISYY